MRKTKLSPLDVSEGVYLELKRTLKIIYTRDYKLKCLQGLGKQSVGEMCGSCSELQNAHTI